MKKSLALLSIILLLFVACGGGDSGGGIDFNEMTDEEIITYMLDTLPDIPGGTEISREYSEPDSSWGFGDNAKLLIIKIADATQADVDAYEASLKADGFIYFPPWEKVINNKLHKVIGLNWTPSFMYLDVVVSDVDYRPTATPSNIIIAPKPNLANACYTKEVSGGMPAGTRITVLETDSANNPATTYTIHYNPRGSNATCTGGVISDNLEATVPLTAGITTWTTKITKLRYSIENSNYEPIDIAYMICNGRKVEVTFQDQLEYDVDTGTLCPTE